MSHKDSRHLPKTLIATQFLITLCLSALVCYQQVQRFCLCELNITVLDDDTIVSKTLCFSASARLHHAQNTAAKNEHLENDMPFTFSSLCVCTNSAPVYLQNYLSAATSYVYSESLCKKMHFSGKQVWMFLTHSQADVNRIHVLR